MSMTIIILFRLLSSVLLLLYIKTVFNEANEVENIKTDPKIAPNKTIDFSEDDNII